MADSVSSRGGAGAAGAGAAGSSGQADFQGALSSAIKKREGQPQNVNGKPSGDSNVNGKPSGANGGSSPALLPAEAAVLAAFETYIEGKTSPLSPHTQKLIDQAVAYDTHDNANQGESDKLWTAARAGIAREALGMMEAYLGSPVNPDGSQDLTQMDPRLLALQMWVVEGGRQGFETALALDQAKMQLEAAARAKDLGELMQGMRADLDKVHEANTDEGIFRRGWERMTGGGGPREDFEAFLNRKIDSLKALDSRNATGTLSADEYRTRLQSIMGDFPVEFQKHVDNVADSDGSWHTIGEVGRSVTAIVVGVVVTASFGPAAGFAAAYGTYEAIDVSYDVGAVAEGKDPYADGHVGLLTGVADLAGADGDFGMTTEHLKTLAIDTSADGISSVAVGVSTAAGMGVSKWVSGALPQWASSEVRARVLAVAAGGVAAQAINSTGSVASDSTRMGIEGNFSGSRLWDESIKPQMVYLAASGPTSAVSGWIPIQKILPAAKAAQNATTASTQAGAVAEKVAQAGVVAENATTVAEKATSASTQATNVAERTAGASSQAASATDNAAGASSQVANANGNSSRFAYKLHYLGVTGQLANDATSNLATAWLADGDILDMSDNRITKNDVIASLGGMVPGTLQNLAAHPQFQQRLEAWQPFNRQAGQRDIALWEWTGFPPDRVRLFPITAAVLGLRMFAQGAGVATGTDVTKVLNDSAIVVTTLRSSLSKFAWFSGNHELVKVYNMALNGDNKALTLFDDIVKDRGWRGIKISNAERPKYHKISGFGSAYMDVKTKFPEVNLKKEIDHLIKTGSTETNANKKARDSRSTFTQAEAALLVLERAYAEATDRMPNEKILKDADQLIKYGNEYTAAQPRLQSIRREIETLVQLGRTYADARAKLPRDQQKFLPPLTVRKLTSPDAVMQSLLANKNIPDSIKDNIKGLHQKFSVLENSNIVQGMLTSPEYMINAIQTLGGKKLSAEQIDDLRAIFKTQNLLEADVSRGGYNNWQAGSKWNDLTWMTTDKDGVSSPGIYQDQARLLENSVTAFLQSPNTRSADSNLLLGQLLGAWQAYVPVYSHSRGKTADPSALGASYTIYANALRKLPPEFQNFPLETHVAESPQDVLGRLRQDQRLPVEVREALGDFNHDTFLLDNASRAKHLLTDNSYFRQKVEELKGKIPDEHYEGITRILDIQDLLKADAADGGFTNLQPGKTWNELSWREVKQGDEVMKAGIYDTEITRLDQMVEEFLATHGKDSSGKEVPGTSDLMQAWKAYVKLYSQTQHDLAASDYEPGIKRQTAEQKLTSSASPDTKYGYVLKASAYGVAVNLLYTWMLKATPATHGLTNDLLWAYYGAEAGLGLYNVFGQIGYLKALSAMTEFRAKYSKAQYIPSDNPADIAVFDPELQAQYKERERIREKWNLIGDIGSVMSAGRNSIIAAAYFGMDLDAMGAMSAANAVLSAGWFLMQRGPGQRTLPHKVQNAIRLSSIAGGIALQSGILLAAYLEAEKIKEKKGPEGDSVAKELENFMNWFIDDVIADDMVEVEVEGEAVSKNKVIDLRGHPLGDRP